MKLQVLARKTHAWAAIIAAAPLLLIIATGVLLQLKKQLPWVQPPEQRGASGVPALSFERVLAVCQSVPQAEIHTWADINRIDVRPARGLLKVWAKNNWEIQLDTQSGTVLQVAYRRSDWIES